MISKNFKDGDMLTHNTNDNILINGTSNARDSVLFTDSSKNAFNFPNINNDTDVEKLIHDFKKDFAITVNEEFSDESLKMNTSIIRSLESSNIKLKRQLCIKSRKKNDEYLVELPQVELYAYGETFDMAVDELKEEFIDLCMVVFSEKKSKLSNKVKKWKKYLEQNILYIHE